MIGRRRTTMITPFECECGAPNCRKIVTGKDWQRPELQRRYAGYFSAYLARKNRDAGYRT